jgi:hypothetical protein
MAEICATMSFATRIVFVAQLFHRGGIPLFEVIDAGRYNGTGLVEDLDGDSGIERSRRMRFPVRLLVSPPTFLKSLSG